MNKHHSKKQPVIETRISADVVDIDPVAVSHFFAGRALKVASSNPITSVLYQDANPSLALQRDEYERCFALPMLKLAPSSSVLDVGCGIGRWAESVLPVTTDYVGVDLTEELIEAARASWANDGGVFHAMPADEISLESLQRDRGFDRMIVAGLLIYMNDSVVLKVLNALAAVATKQCRIWLREPMATEQRLTLRGFWSEELSQNYSAVYRTHNEITELIGATLLKSGFVITADEVLYPDTLNNRADTRQRYMVLESL